MLIDDICDIYPPLDNHKLVESTLFKIDESFEDFVKESIKIMEPQFGNNAGGFALGKLPQLLPYNNLCIFFNDNTMAWYVQEDSIKNKNTIRIGCSVTGKETLLLYKKTIKLIHKLRKHERNEQINELHKGFLENAVFYIEINKNDLSYMGRLSFNKQPSRTISLYAIRNLIVLYRFLFILSCKNIRKKKIYPDEKMQRKRRLLKKRPFLEYYILELKTTASNSQKLPAKELWSNRIHFCRGHMKTYTKERPLFGSIIGRYWWPPHVRGKKEKGVIIKDYQIPK